MPNKVTVVLFDVTRLNNSRSGNPNWKFNTSEGYYRTSSDAAIGYEITNHTNVREGSGEYWIGRRVELSLTKAGRVTDWKLDEQ